MSDDYSEISKLDWIDPTDLPAGAVILENHRNRDDGRIIVYHPLESPGSWWKYVFDRDGEAYTVDREHVNGLEVASWDRVSPWEGDDDE